MKLNVRHIFSFAFLLQVGITMQACQSPKPPETRIQACLRNNSSKYHDVFEKVDRAIVKSPFFRGDDPYYNVYSATRDKKFTIETGDIWPFYILYARSTIEIISGCIQSTGIAEEDMELIHAILNQPDYYNMNGRFDEESIKEFSTKFRRSEIAPFLYDYLIYLVIVRTHIITALPPPPAVEHE